ncbi:MAG: 4-(cytidine 5'-diphospho)-2-C-methyl-D-erythritol kinase [Bacteroidetes bacterium]|nr:4-(cytidine 5'-diphospho)-2-C-methyl-D-erythritol kinase [Bacteroidota bacterium]
MLTFPNGKINIGLFITEKRADGYHNLETIFYPAPVKDVLEIVETEQESSMTITGLPLNNTIADNLVWKAYQLLKDLFPQRVLPIEIHLHKTIPTGAGLGGGSADSAFMLKMLNDYFKLHLSVEELCELALTLGSDCPYFIYNSTQFATGRGDLMQPIPLDLTDFHLQIRYTSVHVSTAKAFQLITPKPASFDLRNLVHIPVMDWKQVVQNDFEEPVFVMHPELADIKQQLYDEGALFASMTGSGSAFFGLFPKH